MESVLRPGGDTADPHKKSTLPVSTQELASAGPSAIDSFDPEPGGETVSVDIGVYPDKPQTFKLRFGLVCEGCVL
jgi:hypothetical protein